METFSGVMLRTHPGLLPDLSAQVNTSLATLNATRLCSKLHLLLHPYRALLMDQATTKGHPLVRSYTCIISLFTLYSQQIITR